MRCFSWVASAVSVSLLSLLMNGCSLFGGAGEDDSPPPVSQPPKTQPFSSPVVKPRLRPSRVAALIQPTNPDERLRVIKTGRRDPFAALFSPVVAGSSGGTPATNSSGNVTITTEGGTSSEPFARSTSGTGTPATNSSGNVTITTEGGTSSEPFALFPPSTSRTSRSTSRTASRSGDSEQLPGLPQSGTRSSGQPTAMLPSPPQPDLAKEVQVTGIVTVNGVSRAIVKAPNEIVSRSVSPGDRLSSEQILVKRIDLSNRAEPIVVLEQYGIEVAVGVGKAPVQLASAPTTTRTRLPAVPALWYDNR